MQIADLFVKARRLGLLGESVAAEQLLTERRDRASRALTASAATASAADYAAAVVTAQAVAVKAAVSTAAAAAFEMRCTEAADVLMTTAKAGGWTDFAVTREQAVFLGLQVLEAETVMQQRRDAATAALSGAVDQCIESWTGHSDTQTELSRSELAQHAEAGSALDMSCTVCTDIRLEQQPAPDRSSILCQSAEHTCYSSWASLFQSATTVQQNSVLRHSQRVLLLIAQALQAVHVQPGTSQPADQRISHPFRDESGQLTWESVMFALLAVLPKQRILAPVKEGAAHTDLAGCLTAARQLGLLQTVKLALQAVQAHVQLQHQQHQAVVAEFDLPTNEHAEDCCSSWQEAPDTWQALKQGVTRAGGVLPSPESTSLHPCHSSARPSNARTQSEAEQVLASASECAQFAPELEQEERDLVQHLVAGLQHGGHSKLPTSICIMLIPVSLSSSDKHFQ